MITTVNDYCQQRGVTKQFVYDYVRKNKFEIIELPVFAEVNGTKIEGGTRKFLRVPEAFDPDLDFQTFNSQAAFVDYLTDYPELANQHKAYFGIKDPTERATFKANMYADLATRPAHEQAAFHEAQSRLNDALMAHMKGMEKRLKRAMKPQKKIINPMNE